MDGRGWNQQLILFRILTQEHVSLFKRRQEKFFQERVMILGSDPAGPPVPAISSSRVLSPSPPAPLPPSPLRTAPRPTAARARQPRSQASPHRNGPFAQVSHHDCAALTPAFLVLMHWLRSPGPARSKAIGPRSRVRHFRLLACARLRGGPRS